MSDTGLLTTAYFGLKACASTAIATRMPRPQYGPRQEGLIKMFLLMPSWRGASNFHKADMRFCVSWYSCPLEFAEENEPQKQDGVRSSRLPITMDAKSRLKQRTSGR
mmetsp:Transcript_48447/g.96372  ORF Transcript_48447/g.96372 Transcript_48447/m.96372 type:complete len:107 (-) Transcript_48447:44-364(-)